MFKSYNLIVVALLAAPMSAQALVEDYSWKFTSAFCDNGSCSGTSSNTAGNSQTFDSNKSTDISEVTVKAFSTTNDRNQANNSIDWFENATLKMYTGGLGTYGAEDSGSTTNGDHAFDNDGNTTDEGAAGDVDAALFSFNQSTTLNSLSIGWKGTDADVSILAYSPTGTNGTMATPDNVVGKSLADLLTNGWVFIGHYLNLSTSGSTTINSAGVSSSFWLVSAYSSCAQGSTYCNSSDTKFGDDYFKISGLGGAAGTNDTPSVPEPSIIFLMFGGLMGWMFTSKNRQLTQNASSIVF